MKAPLPLFVLLAATAGPLVLSQPALAQSAPAEMARALFQQADVNNDGQVSRVEFDAGREALFRRADADHDGRLTLTELRTMRPAGAPTPQRRPSLDQMRKLSAIDRNHDRAVDLNEFRAIGGERFATADQNGDGFIRPGEIANLAQAMGVGS